jgi:hypothetical protein
MFRTIGVSSKDSKLNLVCIQRLQKKSSDFSANAIVPGIANRKEKRSIVSQRCWDIIFNSFTLTASERGGLGGAGDALTEIIPLLRFGNFKSL